MRAAGCVLVDFREALWAVFGLWSRYGLFLEESEFFAELRDLVDSHPDGEGDDEEVDDGLEEFPVRDSRCADGEREIGDVDTIEDDTDEWSDDIGYERCHDLPEGCTDNDTDCEIDDISTKCKFFEVLKHIIFESTVVPLWSGASADTL